MRRWFLNIGAVFPLLVVGYYALPILLGQSDGMEYNQFILRLATSPYFLTGFYIYMGSMFGLAFLPPFFYWLRHVYIKRRLAAGGVKVSAEIISIKSTGIRVNYGLYTDIIARLPDGRKVGLHEKLSLLRLLKVGDMVNVVYDPSNPSIVMLAGGN